jgi:NAD(P)-dependent dehydrogenase (short-subunit alcohol dehydrogenase family)
MRLESKVALITGGYGGGGCASTRLFAREGATIFVAGRNHERGNGLVAEINDAGATRISLNWTRSIRTGGMPPLPRSRSKPARCTS